jgi:zinc transport system permease protein
MEIFAYSFMQRALLAGLLISLACSVLGVFLILRRDAMLGHGLAEVAFGGIALGLFLNVLPLASAVTIAILGALGMLKLKQKAGVHGDTAIGIMASFGMALGILVVSLAGSFNVNLFGYVFGNVLAIRSAEVWLAAFLAAGVVGAVLLFYQEFFFMTFDEEAARVSGIRVDLLNGVLAVLSAVTVVLAMKVVGILLVAAMIIVPAAASLQIAKSFRQAIWLSALISMSTVLLGLMAAALWDLPPAGTIVVLSTLVFLVCLALRRSALLWR